MFSLVLVAACGDDLPTRWQLVADELDEALLSITGTSPTDVWAVGADLGRGPLVVHYDGDAWQRIDTGHQGHLWWAHAFAGGELYAGGASGAILAWDGAGFRRMATPGLGRDTVFGLWGRAPDDAYAVGGAAGRHGFVWHYDGEAWTPLDLPADVPLTTDGTAPGLFKVWGDDAGTVWIVGARGTVLRRRGDGPLEVVASDTTDPLFTVAGQGDRIAIVGGLGVGRLLEGADGELADRAPDGAPLLQGVAFGPDGQAWASGQDGMMYELVDGAWRWVDHGLALAVESLHATWVDPTGGVWAVGGDVLSPALAGGAVIHRGPALAPLAPAPRDDDPPPAARCPSDQIDPAPPGSSMARRWNEQILGAIRRDVPRPGVHARNLYHLSAAMWDAWAAYDATADAVFAVERIAVDGDPAAARDEAIAYAAYRVLTHRYDPRLASPAGAAVSQACFVALMERLGLDPDDATTAGGSPRAVGNRIGAAVLAATVDDGANEAGAYADTTGFVSLGPPLSIDAPGTPLMDPDAWQPLDLAESVTQNGIPLAGGVQPYIGPHWGEVTPFAIARSGLEMVAELDVATPALADPTTVAEVVEVIRRQARLAVDPAVAIDISPGALGDNALGQDDGAGHPLDPSTGAPYPSNVVVEGDFGRVLAEFWADGPRSETPPGHWFVLANQVADHPAHVRALFGEGAALDPLAWDVATYVALGGAVHDAAVVAWGVKRGFLSSRPITMIRHMAARGQRSDPAAPAYHPDGLPLEPGLIELVTAASSAPGQRHAHLAPYVGQVAVLAWRGEPGDRAAQVGGVDWIRGVDWLPYQRRNFVTPAFPGFVSGHSTFSRAAADALTALTGDRFFPGGAAEFVARDGYLTFERGPSQPIALRWATYQDAADQAGQSRLWGGIHITADDHVGRRLGAEVARAAVERARRLFDGSERP